VSRATVEKSLLHTWALCLRLSNCNGCGSHTRAPPAPRIVRVRGLFSNWSRLRGAGAMGHSAHSSILRRADFRIIKGRVSNSTDVTGL